MSGSIDATEILAFLLESSAQGAEQVDVALRITNRTSRLVSSLCIHVADVEGVVVLGDTRHVVGQVLAQQTIVIPLHLRAASGERVLALRGVSFRHGGCSVRHPNVDLSFYVTEPCQPVCAAGADSPCTLVLPGGLKTVPYVGSCPYAFVSYARADSASVYPLIGDLARRDFRFWWDAGIPLGSDWYDEVAPRVAKAAVVVLFLSKAAAPSKWVCCEVTWAKACDKRILAVYLEAVQLPDGLAMLLHGIQSIMPGVPHRERVERLSTALALAGVGGQPHF